jgi:hypothetical protein
MRTAVAVFVGMLLVASSLIAPPPAMAIPAFSRMYGQSCSACHTAYPKLNQAGEEFRLSGYTRFEGGAAIPKVQPLTMGKLSLPGIVPVSVIGTVGYDSHKVTERRREGHRVRTLDPNSINLEEIEIAAASPLNRYLSFVLDFPLAETEFENRNFTLGGPEAPELAAVSFNNLWVDDLINFRIGAYELPLGFSPGHRRLSSAPYEVYGATAQKLLGLEGAAGTGIGAEGRIFKLSKTQLLAELYGTAYSERLGVSSLLLRYHFGTANDSNRTADNNSSKSVFGRLSLGYLGQTIGFFGFWSPNILDRSRPTGFPGRSNEVVRVGPDLHLTFLDEALSLAVQYLWGRDNDPTGVGKAFNFSGGFVEANYVIRAGGLGRLVPLARFDYVRGDKFDNTTKAAANALAPSPVRTKPLVWALTGGLYYLPWDNVKLSAEVTYRETEEQLSQMRSTVEKDRISETLIGLQVTLAF